MTTPKKEREGYTHWSKEILAAARAMYEADPKMSLAMCASKTGIPHGTLKNHSRREKWKKAAVEPAKVVKALAQEMRDKAGPNPTPEQQEAARQETSEELAIRLRTTLLKKHQEELDYPRRLAYQAVAQNNFETAKLAKITSETLRNVQELERKAWGIDRAEDNNVTVLIDRKPRRRRSGEDDEVTDE